MSEKEEALYFNFMEVCFLTFLDTSKTQRARPFPSFSRESHAKQDGRFGCTEAGINRRVTAPSKVCALRVSCCNAYVYR